MSDYCGPKKYLDRLAVSERVDGGYERGQLRKQLSCWSDQVEHNRERCAPTWNECGSELWELGSTKYGQSQWTASNVDETLHHLAPGLPNSGLWTGLV